INLLKMRNKRRSRNPYVVIERIDFPAYRERIDPAQVEKLAQVFRQSGVDEIIVKKEYEWTVESLPDLTQQPSLKVCTFPWYAMVICWDGTVAPCPQDFMIGMNMGTVRTQSIREIWNGQPYQKLRRGLSQDISSLKLCRKCDRLCRKQVGGVPFQYLITFLSDQFIGYGRMRRLVGSFERN
ncbi:conserved hypothetical protein, partial [sediment metagenome]